MHTSFICPKSKRKPLFIKTDFYYGALLFFFSVPFPSRPHFYLFILLTDPPTNSQRLIQARESRIARHKQVIGTRSEELDPLMSPMYSHLKCNLPKEIMSFLDLPLCRPSSTQEGTEGLNTQSNAFPSSSSFLGHEDIVQYLHYYTQHHDLTSHIQRNTTVMDAVPIQRVLSEQSGGEHGGEPGWIVETRNNRTNIKTKHDFDWLIVANGHHNIPDKHPVQSVKNLHQFKGVIMHSVEFDDTESFKGMNVLVVGAKASGSDIAHGISQHAKTVYICDRHYPSRSSSNNSNGNSSSSSSTAETEVVGIKGEAESCSTQHTNGKFFLRPSKG